MGFSNCSSWSAWSRVIGSFKSRRPLLAKSFAMVSASGTSDARNSIADAVPGART